MDHAVLQIVMRYAHILSAVTAVGGLLFMAFCLAPVARLLADDARQPFVESVHKRFLCIVNVAIILLIVSGVYNWGLLAQTYKSMGPVGNALLGIKVLLALIMFVVIWLRTAGLFKNDKAARMINVHLAAIVILLAVILRYYRLEYLAGG